MINFNGAICASSEILITKDNRAFRYGDAVFETLKVIDSNIQFLEDHYFRLMASMHLLRMEVPMDFNLEFFENEIKKTIKANNIDKIARVRLTVYRKDGGFFSPLTNDIDFIIEAVPLKINITVPYVLDLYKDFYIQANLLSTIKTTNRIINVLGSVFASENGFDNCILLNHHKHVAEVLNGNIFLIKKNHIITPALEEGCINGIYRKKIIESITESDVFTIEETQISPFEIQKADEIFITNTIQGIQPVTQYKKKKFSNETSLALKELMKEVF